MVRLFWHEPIVSYRLQCPGEYNRQITFYYLLLWIFSRFQYYNCIGFFLKNRYRYRLMIYL